MFMKMVKKRIVVAADRQPGTCVLRNMYILVFRTPYKSSNWVIQLGKRALIIRNVVT
jgi:hypothetical protein